MGGLGGRDAELRAVRHFLHTVESEPAALVVTGEHGIGKTALWNVAIELAERDGLAVLSARGYAAEVQLAYSGLADLVGGVDDAILDQLGPVQRDTVDRILLRRQLESAPNERAAGAALVAILELMGRPAPVILAIDDAQWVDPSSQVAIGYAARRVTGRVGFLATAAPADDASTWIQVPRLDSLTRITLPPLDRGTIHALIADRLGFAMPVSLTKRIHQMSGGNPLYAIELARTMDERSLDRPLPLPASLQQLVSAQLDGLSAECAELLMVLACLPKRAVKDVVSATAMAPERVIAILEEAEMLGVVAVDGGAVRFTRPFFAYGAYFHVEPPTRRALHRRMAMIVDDPEVRARHLGLAAVEADDLTLQELDTAAIAAASRGARGAAAELLEMAIRLGGDDAERRLRAAEQHLRAGAFERAEMHLTAVLDEVPAGAARSFALVLRGALHLYRDGARAIESLNTAVEQCADQPPMELCGLLLLSFVLERCGEIERSLDCARRAVAVADGLGDPSLQSLALATVVMAEFNCGLGVDSDTLRRAIALEDRGSATAAPLMPSNVEAVICAWTGQLESARSKITAMLQRSQERGDEIDFGWAIPFAVMVDLWSGRLADAQAAADQLMASAELTGGQLSRIAALSCRAAVAAHCGRADEARRAARAAIDAAHASGFRRMVIAPLTSLAFLEISLGDHAGALAVLDPLLTTFDAKHTEVSVAGYLPDAIEALIAVGRSGEAEPLIAALEANGTQLDRPWMLAAGARGRAALLAAKGDLVAARLCAERATTAHEFLPMPFERARTEFLIGQLHRSGRRRKAAAASFESALTVFETLGAQTWAHRARQALRECRPRPSNPSLTLTATERRVAERAAAGYSNRDIAAQLFVSVKAIEQNLSRVYRKLGIRSRAQLYSRLIEMLDSS